MAKFWRKIFILGSRCYSAVHRCYLECVTELGPVVFSECFHWQPCERWCLFRHSVRTILALTHCWLCIVCIPAHFPPLSPPECSQQWKPHKIQGFKGRESPLAHTLIFVMHHCCSLCESGSSVLPHGLCTGAASILSCSLPCCFGLQFKDDPTDFALYFRKQKWLLWILTTCTKFQPKVFLAEL